MWVYYSWRNIDLCMIVGVDERDLEVVLVKLGFVYECYYCECLGGIVCNFFVLFDELEN